MTLVYKMQEMKMGKRQINDFDVQNVNDFGVQNVGNRNVQKQEIG